MKTSAVTLYGYKKCSTCRQAEKLLVALGRSYQFIDIVEHPPTARALAQIMEQAQLPIKVLFNTSGVLYRERDIKTRLPTLSVDAALDLLASEGKLLKRPIVTDGVRATVGLNEALFRKTWG